MLVYYVCLLALAGSVLTAPMHHMNKRQILGVTPDFGRGIPNSVYHGEFGSLFGSPIFGPGLTGPFNDPVLRQMRIEELYDENRRVNRVPPMRNQFRLSDVDLRSLPFSNYFGGSAGMAGMGAMMGMMGPMGMAGRR